MVTHELTCHIIVIQVFPKNLKRYAELNVSKSTDKLDKTGVKVQGQACTLMQQVVGHLVHSSPSNPIKINPSKSPLT